MIIKRVGGKDKLAKWIYSNLPEGQIFIDVFGGSGSVLDFVYRKQGGLRCVYNDLDSKLYVFFSILQNKAFDLANIINLTPYSRKFFEEAHEAMENESHFNSLCELDKAVIFLIVNRQCFGAKMENSWSITRDGEINYDSWKKLPAYILKVAQTWKSVFLENLDYRELISKWDSAESVFYLDPPYEGVEDNYYAVNKKDGFNHLEMLNFLKEIQGAFCVSYYGGTTKLDDSELIDAYKSFGCSIYRKPVKKHLSGEGEKSSAIEVLLVKGDGRMSNHSSKNLVQKLFED